MTESEVKRIVLIALKELYKAELLQNAESAAYKEISDRLYRYFSGADDSELLTVMRTLFQDKYFFVIPSHYRDGKTLEEIAEEMDVDIRTISRHKKRICLEIFKRLQPE